MPRGVEFVIAEREITAGAASDTLHVFALGECELRPCLFLPALAHLGILRIICVIAGHHYVDVTWIIFVK